MTRCTSASFKDRGSAVTAKRRIMRTLRLTSTVSYCEKCDKYHLVAEHRHPLTERWVMILQCLAQGYRDAETAEVVKMSARSVEWSVAEMMKRFYALSRPNLIAIAISLGIINPNDFVPAEEEAKHA